MQQRTAIVLVAVVVAVMVITYAAGWLVSPE
jgi:hypothetical protein